MPDRNAGMDRLWAWFAVSSVLFVSVLAVSPVKDWFREYRPWQNAYRRLLLEKAGSARELRQAQAQTVGIRQIWMPEFGRRVDRCVTCHLGVEDPRLASADEPFRAHPVTPHTPDDFRRFGCTVCHRGQGRATSLAEAHGDVPDWDEPLLPLRYTEASCGRCHIGETVPSASLLSAGRALMGRAGCFGCHKVAGHEDWKSEAPDLDGIGARTNPAWLRAWLKSPRSLRPATWMPDFHLADSEIEALAAFLGDLPPQPAMDLGPEGEPPAGDADRGKTLFGQSRCVSCHTIEGRGNGSAPELSGVGSEVNRRWLIAFLGNPEAFQPGTRMPRYAFTRQDLLDLSQYIMDELTDASAPAAPAKAAASRPAQKTVQEGEKLYRKYGCGGCHRIAGRHDAAPIGPDLTGIGDKPAAQLDFGGRDDLPRRLPDWLAAKVSQPRSFREGLRMPDFNFTPDQVTQVVTALLSEGREPIDPPYRVETVASRYAPPGRFGALASRYRCQSCHQIQGAGGDISTAPLTAEGSRARKEWLTRYLLNPTTIRPVLTERMIPLRMPQEEAAFMADFMSNVYVDDAIPDEIFPGGPPPEQVNRGRKLFFERYGCQACHMSGGRGGYYGPMLDGAGERLRSGWVAWWLRGPQKARADVRCPDFGLDENDARDLTAFVVSLPAAAPAAPAAGGAGR